MSSRPKWRTVVIALGLIAAIAIAAPVFGLDRSIKRAIKKEVSKQIGKATGPAGPTGAAGANGANGLDGSARAYARVHPHAFDSCAPECAFDRDQGISSVTRVGAGRYCVTADGINALDTPAAVTVDWGPTAAIEGNASAMISFQGFCSADQFKVKTDRQPTTEVRNAADNGSTDVAGNAVDADNVGFTIVIP